MEIIMVIITKEPTEMEMEIPILWIVMEILMVTLTQDLETEMEMETATLLLENKEQRKLVELKKVILMEMEFNIKMVLAMVKEMETLKLLFTHQLILLKYFTPTSLEMEVLLLLQETEMEIIMMLVELVMVMETEIL